MWILTNNNYIIIKNEHQDREEIIFKEDIQKFLLDHWCPRENITYSQKELTISEAWEYATKHAQGSIEKALAALKL
jgi:hypothetical protein